MIKKLLIFLAILSISLPCWAGIYFNGDGDQITTAGEIIPALAVADDFTWMAWVYVFDACVNTSPIFGNRYGGDSSPLSFAKLNRYRFEYYVGGLDPALDWTIPADEWAHVAIVKDGADMTYYGNGTVRDTGTNTTAMGETNPFPIGADGTGFTTDTNDDKWYSEDFSLVILAANDYHFAWDSNLANTALYDDVSPDVFHHYTPSTYATGVLENPWPDTAPSTRTRKFSLYGEYTPSGASAIKTINGLAKASVKTVDGLAIANVKSRNGLE